MNIIQVFIETGQKRVFAGAVDWPGWCRTARDEASALQVLLDYTPRYAKMLRAVGFDFAAPGGIDDFTILERHAGNATTDFGAPTAILEADWQPPEPAELERLQGVLEACWRALDRAAHSAAGQPLKVGPRGGGRQGEAILAHVNEAERAYLSKLGWKAGDRGEDDPFERLGHTHRQVLAGLEAAARGELPTQGPRGGKMWPVRYFIRRSAWHVLDHAWEIEDRAV